MYYYLIINISLDTILIYLKKILWNRVEWLILACAFSVLVWPHHLFTLCRDWPDSLSKKWRGPVFLFIYLFFEAFNFIQSLFLCVCFSLLHLLVVIYSKKIPTIRNKAMGQLLFLPTRLSFHCQTKAPIFDHCWFRCFSFSISSSSQPFGFLINGSEPLVSSYVQMVFWLWIWVGFFFRLWIFLSRSDFYCWISL